MQTEKVAEITAYFGKLFGPEPKCELNYSTEVELLVAIMLSAQCTDKRVNIVTRDLFKRFKTIQDFAAADQTELEKLVYSTGFYHNKAKNIIATCKKIMENHGGKIPNTLEELSKLPGVGRKTASVFLCEFHNIPAIPIDTHVARVSNRLGFTTNRNPLAIERDLAKLLPREDWPKFHLQTVLFGRYYCTARNPKCESCEISKFCNNVVY